MEQCLIVLADKMVSRKRVFLEPLRQYADFTKYLIVEQGYEQIGPVPDGMFDDIYEVHDYADFEEFEHIVSRINVSHEIAAILIQTEREVEIGGYLRTRFGIPGLQKNQSEAVRNKWLMKEMLRQTGMKTTPSMIATHRNHFVRFTEKNGFPVICKPLNGWATMRTYKFDTMQEIRQWLDQNEGSYEFCLLEKYVGGREFHVDSIVYGGEVLFTSVSEYAFTCLDVVSNNKPLISITYPKKDDALDFIRDMKLLNEKVINGLGIRSSITHAEYFLSTDGEITFGEIGARIGGFQIVPPLVRNTHGIDLFQAAVDIELGRYQHDESRRKDLYTGAVCFPSRNGQIVSISSHNDYSDVPGIVDYEVYYQVGQSTTNVNDTSIRSGTAVVEGADFITLRETLLKMYDQFQLVTV